MDADIFRMQGKSLFLLVCLFLTGCQAAMYGTASDLNDLSIGMPKAEVIKALGEPSSTGANGDAHEEYLIYRRMKHTIAWGPTWYKITLKNGAVSAWGEEKKETGNEH